LVLTTQQEVALLEELLVQRSLVLRRQLVGGNHAADLVDGACDAPIGDEARKVTGGQSHCKGRTNRSMNASLTPKERLIRSSVKLR
jgi:hypothetical protein